MFLGNNDFAGKMFGDLIDDPGHLQDSRKGVYHSFNSILSAFEGAQTSAKNLHCFRWL